MHACRSACNRSPAGSRNRLSQQPQQGPLLGEQQQQPPSNQQQQQPPLNQQQQQDPVNPQGQEHNDHDDLESIDLLSTSSNQSDPVQPNWFRRMFKKK